MDASRGGSEGTLQSFLEKVFVGALDANRTPLLTFDDCRHRLETMFEEKYQPERDFLDYLNVKKERCYEDFLSMPDKQKQAHGKDDISKKRSLPAGDDQDLMPMDLDEDHNLPSGLAQQYGR